MKSLSALLFLTSLALTAQAQTKKIQVAPGLQATVVHEPGSKTVDVLLPGVSTIELELSQPVSNNFLIKAGDFNFDGYKDFAMTSKDAAPGAPVVYDIYLYHPADKSFEALELPGGVCEHFSNVRLSAGDKTLRSSCRSGTKSSMDIFRYGSKDAFALELVKSVDNSAEAQQDTAEEKADKKTEKKDQQQDKRDDLKQRKADKKEEKEDEDN